LTGKSPKGRTLKVRLGVLLSPGFRSLILTNILFLSVTLSHHLAGGQIQEFKMLYLLLIATFLFFWKKPIKNFEGPSLAAILIIFQLLGHILMQQNTANSDSRMIFSHTFSILLTYSFAKKIDELAQHVYLLIRDIFIPRIIRLFSISYLGQRIIHNQDFSFYSNFHIQSIQVRAPPFNKYA